jgi:hypothetical protein
MSCCKNSQAFPARRRTSLLILGLARGSASSDRSTSTHFPLVVGEDRRQRPREGECLPPLTRFRTEGVA